VKQCIEGEETFSPFIKLKNQCFMIYKRQTANFIFTEFGFFLGALNFVKCVRRSSETIF
jgi:hypothetical protein